VQEAVAAKAIYKCNKAMVITNSHFTAGAVVLAAANDCTLVDREELGKWILAQ
jgi:restriction system protein